MQIANTAGRDAGQIAKSSRLNRDCCVICRLPSDLILAMRLCHIVWPRQSHVR